jgi:3-oxoacyl-[acyl-carrier-protein] synthase II
MGERVVVTGIGCLSSLGIGAGTFVDQLLAGHSGIAPVTRFSTEGCRSHSAALVRGFDPAEFIDPMKLRRIDEVGRLALVSCRLAAEDARLPADSDEIGVVLGSATAGLHSTVTHLQSLVTAGAAGVPALGFSNMIGNAAASLCALEFKWRGPNLTVAQKQASALSAMAFSAELLEQGRAVAFLCGGVDDIEEKFYRVHDQFRVLSPIDGGQEAGRPFYTGRNGFVLGAGGHMLVLETASSAKARGIMPYGEILGVGASSSVCRSNAWPTDSAGIVRAMRDALARASLAAADVSVVFAAANASRELDRIEALAVEQVFGPFGVPVVSIKGAIGESGASGAASLTAALVALHRGMLPPTLGCEPRDPACQVDVSPAARPSNGRIALVNATADGGAHYSFVARAPAPGRGRLRP